MGTRQSIGRASGSAVYMNGAQRGASLPAPSHPHQGVDKILDGLPDRFLLIGAPQRQPAELVAATRIPHAFDLKWRTPSVRRLSSALDRQHRCTKISVPRRVRRVVDLTKRRACAERCSADSDSAFAPRENYKRATAWWCIFQHSLQFANIVGDVDPSSQARNVLNLDKKRRSRPVGRLERKIYPF